MKDSARACATSMLKGARVFSPPMRTNGSSNMPNNCADKPCYFSPGHEQDISAPRKTRPPCSSGTRIGRALPPKTDPRAATIHAIVSRRRSTASSNWSRNYRLHEPGRGRLRTSSTIVTISKIAPAMADGPSVSPNRAKASVVAVSGSASAMMLAGVACVAFIPRK